MSWVGVDKLDRQLGLTVAVQQAMINAVRDNKRILQAGLNERPNPYVKAACELVKSGAIGKVEHTVCTVDRHNKTITAPGWLPMTPPKKFDYDFWLGSASTGD